MSSPIISPELKAELDPLPWRVRIALKGFRFFEQKQERRVRVESLRQARQYEKKAEGAAGTNQIEASKLRVSAGRAYINARKPNNAVRNFEEAQPELEAYMRSGVSDGFICLAGLYQSLEHAYRKTGDEEKALEIHEKSLALTAAREEHFGVSTNFLPSGDVLISSSAPLAEPAA